MQLFTTSCVEPGGNIDIGGLKFQVIGHFGERKDGDVALVTASMTDGLGDQTHVVLKQYSATVRGDPEYDPNEYVKHISLIICGGRRWLPGWLTCWLLDGLATMRLDRNHWTIASLVPACQPA